MSEHIPSKYFVVLSIFFLPFLSHAQVVINEIMYAPASGSNYEWIEIFNKGNSSINLENYRFFHGETNSGPLSLKNGSTFILQPSEYAIIARSLSDYTWLNFSGMILGASTVSLPDTGDNTYIAISDSNKVILDYIKYDTSLGGSKESGASLQRQTDGTWIAASSTPGAVNSNTPIVVTSDPDPAGSSTPSQTESNQNNSSSLSSHSSYVEISTYKPPEMLSVTIGRNRLASTGIPTEFEAKSNITVSNVNYHWTFGDGASAEGRRVEHIYDYAGDYVVVMNAKYFEDVSVSRTNIKVTEPKLSIEEANDSYIKIKNDSTYEINLYGWKLYFENKAFVFPIDTIILAGVSTEFSSGITGFHPSDMSQITLSTSDKPAISNIFSAQTTTPKVDQISELYKKAVQIKNELASLETNEIEVSQTKVATTESKKEINLNNLASPIVSISSTTESINNWFNTFKRFLFKRN